MNAQGKNMGKKNIDGSTKPISDVICGDLRGGNVHSIKTELS